MNEKILGGSNRRMKNHLMQVFGYQRQSPRGDQGQAQVKPTQGWSDNHARQAHVKKWRIMVLKPVILAHDVK